MRLDKIRLQNFRCFADNEFHLASRFNLLVGDNGTGKTSVLQGISLAVSELLNGFPGPAPVAYSEVDHTRHTAYWNGGTLNCERHYPVAIECHGYLNSNFVAWQHNSWSEGGQITHKTAGTLRAQAQLLAGDVVANRPALLPVLGFYNSRRMWQSPASNEPVTTLPPTSRFTAYQGSLEPATEERRLFEWFKTRELIALQHKQALPALEAVRQALQRCIPRAQAVLWDYAADQLAVTLANETVWFRQLSDGYRNTLAMVADIAQRCVMLNPHLAADAITETPGVVLIDEIDLHLHPKWQRHVVADLLRTFPKVQFIATTHSPFIIQSLVPQEGVKLINLDDPEATDFASKSIEDIVEEVQGIAVPQRSQRYLEMFETAKQYYAKLKEADDKNGPELERLKQELDTLIMPFSDDPAYHALLQAERIVSGIDRNGSHATH